MRAEEDLYMELRWSSKPQAGFQIDLIGVLDLEAGQESHLIECIINSKTKDLC